MHIFLTGGTGYIGGAVMAQALAQGHRVTALVRSDQAQMQVQLSGAEGIIGDLATPEHWATRPADLYGRGLALWMHGQCGGA